LGKVDDSFSSQKNVSSDNFSNNANANANNEVGDNNNNKANANENIQQNSGAKKSGMKLSAKKKDENRYY